MLALLFAVSLARTPIDLAVKVDAIERRAVVYPSTVTNKSEPLVFVFHGFTGFAKQAAFSYRVHDVWPEATVVYPQGLEVSMLGTKGPGWQFAAGQQGDRDLKFYDALLSKVEHEYKVDSKRVYSCGMSNGAIFTYLLIAKRGDTLAAAAPVAGFAMPAFASAPATPILITHGTKDPLVPFRAAERGRDTALKNNGAGATTKEWAPGYLTYTPVRNHNDVVWHVHEGGHTWPAGTTEAIVRFFKEHARP